MATNVYEMVTDRIIAQLEQGRKGSAVHPWGTGCNSLMVGVYYPYRNGGWI